MTKQKNKPLKKADYERLGQALESIVVSGHYDKKRLFRIAFLRGVFTGLGSVIGATIVLALILWILSFVESIPFIGTISENIQEAVDSP